MTVHHTIHIEAPPDAVWAVTEDVERWPDWTPTVAAVRRLDARPFGLGSVVEIRQPAQPPARWTVTEYVPGARFAWATARPGLRMVGTHALTAARGGTTNHLSLEASGVLGTLLWPILYPATRWALARENAGLKRRCEAKAAS